MDTAVKRDRWRGHGDRAGRRPQAEVAAAAEIPPDVATVVVEEIFLEGDSMTLLRHEAGSAQAIDLLESADGPGPAPAATKQSD
jgi:hypothetical protein